MSKARHARPRRSTRRVVRTLSIAGLGAGITAAGASGAFAADYKVNDHAKVFARIDNLFDERYEEPTGFLRPGFAVYGGIRLTN